MLYPLSYGGQPLAGRDQVVGRKAMYQRASGDPLTVVQTIIFVVLFSTRAGRSVERVRRAGGWARRAARTHQLCQPNYACASRTAKHAASMGRTAGRRVLHRCRRHGGATSEQQRELARRQPPHHRGWRRSGGAAVRRNRSGSRPSGPGTYPRQHWSGLAGGSRNRRRDARTILHRLGSPVR